MLNFEIALGPADALAVLYTYPNLKNDGSTLAQTIEHWMRLTLRHDGLEAEGASCDVRNDRDDYTLVLSGPDALEPHFQMYGIRLPQFLEHGLNAYENDVGRIQAGRTIKPWDPILNDWRFFLTHGLPLARPKTLQFFHYPPIRLLALRNYLMDPVPRRCEELLVANGVGKRHDFDENGPSMTAARQYECVMDCCPIGASDEQGQLGTIPIDEFYPYQTAQTRMLIGDPRDEFVPLKGWKNGDHTIPIVVYGQHPKRVFSKLFLDERDTIYQRKKGDDWGKSRSGELKDNSTVKARNIIAGKHTPVLGSTHPYAYYGTSQVGPMGLPASEKGKIGQGFIHRGYVQDGSDGVAGRMIKDLTIARWQKTMADDPTQDVLQVLKDCTSYWEDESQRHEVYALSLHQGSLWYPCFAQGKEPLPDDPDSCVFTWNLSFAEAEAMVKEYDGNFAKCIEALFHKAKSGGDVPVGV